MYNDQYRNRFSTVNAAISGKEILNSTDGNDVIFTPLHNHMDFEVLLIKKGKARFIIGEHEFIAQEGDVVLVNPYETHSSYALSGFLPFSYYCITFDLSLLLATSAHPSTKLCEKLTEGYIKFNHLIKDENLYCLILETEQLFRKKNEGWEFFLSAILFNFFGCLYSNKYYSSISTPSKAHIFTREVVKYIQMHFCENITSTTLAEYFSYDKSYFCRLFKKNFGLSFGEYMNAYRVNYAKELIKSGSSVSDAAYLSGFNNLSYFTKIFKRQTGFLPSKKQ